MAHDSTVDTYQKWVDRVNTHLDARMASYPDRDQAYDDLCLTLTEFAELLTDSLDQSDSQPTKERQATDSPVFLCGSMKSGTTLLTQLLDGHPDLFVMPGDSGFIQQKDKWQRDDFSSIARHWIHRLINPTGKRPFWFLGPDRISLEKFLLHLRHSLTHTTETIFSCVVHALIDVQRPDDSSPRYWVEKNPHNELHIDDLLSHYPDARFVHILRSPLDNIASLQRNAAVRGWTSTPFERAHELKLLFQAGIDNLKKLGPQRYHILRYEDLVANPEATMGELATFLGIAHQDSLLIPTEAGATGMSNSMYTSDRVEGRITNTSEKQRYRTELSKAEIRDIVTILNAEAEALGYDWSGPELDGLRRGPLGQAIRQIRISVGSRIRRR